jgi:hypothetical protein
MALLGPFQTITDVGWGNPWEEFFQPGDEVQVKPTINSKLRVRVDFEDSIACGGTSDKSQGVILERNFKTVYGGILTINSVQGIVGPRHPDEFGTIPGFRLFILFRWFSAFEDQLIYDFQSLPGDPVCAEFSPIMTKGPLSLAIFDTPPGDSVVSIYFSSGYSKYHKNAFFDVSLSFQEKDEV